MRTPSTSSFVRPLATVLALASPALAAAAPVDFGSELRRHGVRELPSPVEAPAFTLAELGGGTASLADWRGRWVLLTFWATWCGPCRSEMPSLDRLHRRLGDGPAVVAVAVERDRAAIERFVSDYRLELPILVDPEGAVGRLYRAESIPLTYLVDPAGRLTAVARGARDWAAMESLWEALPAMPVAGEPVAAARRGAGDEQRLAETRSAETRSAETGAGEPVAAEAGAAAPLPAVFDPPRATWSVTPVVPVPGDEFYLDVRVEWSGSFDEYLLHPPKVHLPEGVERRGVTASTSSRDGRSVVRYRLALAAAEGGSYLLDPVEIAYTPRFEAAPVARRVSGPRVEIRPRRLFGLDPGVAALGGGGTLALLGALALAVRRRRHRESEAPAADDPARHAADLDAARRQRLEGDAAGFLVALAEIEGRLGVPGEERAVDARMEEEARYGGRAPGAAELERIERRVARRLDELTARTQAARRPPLRLRDAAE